MTLRVIITVFIIALNIGTAGLQIWLLRRRKPWPKLLGAAVCLWTTAMLGIFLVHAFEPAGWKPFARDHFYFPMAVEMFWHFSLPLLICPGLILTALVVRRLPSVTSAKPISQEGLSRRKFLYLAAFGAAPITALGMGVHGSLSRYDLRLRKLNVPIAGLPPELEGFTIAHVSDFHSGDFVGPARLKIISDAANDLKADLVAMTGDVINYEMSEFPAALTAMQAIGSRYGTYLCEGNHDVVPGPRLVVEACARNNLPMLYNSCAAIPVRGRRLLIGGVPWMRHGFEGRPELVSNLYPARQEGDVRILLAHHPHLFDEADSVDLVLSGHTHGGQIMIGPLGFGPLFFKYWTGLYERGNTRLVVSNGCGDWFPCRIGAPAEIGLLRLTAAKVA